jgi:hypothetical protein
MKSKIIYFAVSKKDHKTKNEIDDKIKESNIQFSLKYINTLF